jgi:hypothetical protein
MTEKLFDAIEKRAAQSAVTAEQDAAAAHAVALADSLAWLSGETKRVITEVLKAAGEVGFAAILAAADPAARDVLASAEPSLKAAWEQSTDAPWPGERNAAPAPAPRPAATGLVRRPKGFLLYCTRMGPRSDDSSTAPCGTDGGGVHVQAVRHGARMGAPLACEAMRLQGCRTAPGMARMHACCPLCHAGCRLQDAWRVASPAACCARARPSARRHTPRSS